MRYTPAERSFAPRARLARGIAGQKASGLQLAPAKQVLGPTGT